MYSQFMYYAWRADTLRLVKNGQYYPGMMYIENGGMWYSPAQYDPPNGGCADRRPGRKTLAFTLRKTQIAGVTLCTRFFNRRSFFSLGEPGENLGIAGINTYVKTSTIALVHEFAHLVDSSTYYPRWAHRNKPSPIVLMSNRYQGRGRNEAPSW